MQSVRANGIEIAYVERGTGEETIVFSHSYLVDHRHFDAQIESLSANYRVIAFDHRDHGRSQKTPAAYSLDDLVTDAVGLIRGTESAPCHFVGLSTGGFIGLRLALRHPDLLRSLVLMDTSAAAEPALKRLKYRAMFLVLRFLGFGPLMPSVTGLMFGPALLEDSERAGELALWSDRMRANDRLALIRFGNAIFARDSVLADLERIAVPSLIVVGENDRPQPPARARQMADGIPDARLEIVPRAGHLSSVDAPEFVTETLTRFLDGLPATA
ncbi:MAG: alpha/beta fold hydrolase [Thermoanaerobaculia bacterium]